MLRIVPARSIVDIIMLGLWLPKDYNEALQESHGSYWVLVLGVVKFP